MTVYQYRRKLCLSFITHVFNVLAATDCVKAYTIKMFNAFNRINYTYIVHAYTDTHRLRCKSRLQEQSVCRSSTTLKLIANNKKCRGVCVSVCAREYENEWVHSQKSEQLIEYLLNDATVLHILQKNDTIPCVASTYIGPFCFVICIWMGLIGDGNDECAIDFECVRFGSFPIFFSCGITIAIALRLQLERPEWSSLDGSTLRSVDTAREFNTHTHTHSADSLISLWHLNAIFPEIILLCVLWLG